MIRPWLPGQIMAAWNLFKLSLPAGQIPAVYLNVDPELIREVKIHPTWRFPGHTFISIEIGIVKSELRMGILIESDWFRELREKHIPLKDMVEVFLISGPVLMDMASERDGTTTMILRLFADPDLPILTELSLVKVETPTTIKTKGFAEVWASCRLDDQTAHGVVVVLTPWIKGCANQAVLGKESYTCLGRKTTVNGVEVYRQLMGWNKFLNPILKDEITSDKSLEAGMRILHRVYKHIGSCRIVTTTQMAQLLQSHGVEISTEAVELALKPVMEHGWLTMIQIDGEWAVFPTYRFVILATMGQTV